MLFLFVMQEVTNVIVGYLKLTFSEKEAIVMAKKKKKSIIEICSLCNVIMCCRNIRPLLSPDCLKISGVILSNSFIPINFAVSERGGDNTGPTDCLVSLLFIKKPMKIC